MSDGPGANRCRVGVQHRRAPSTRRDAAAARGHGARSRAGAVVPYHESPRAPNDVGHAHPPQTPHGARAARRRRARPARSARRRSHRAQRNHYDHRDAQPARTTPIPQRPWPRFGRRVYRRGAHAPCVRAVPPGQSPAQSPATIGRRGHLAATVAHIVRRYERTEEATRTTRVDCARVNVAAEVARVSTPPASFPDSDRPHHADVSSPAAPGRASAALPPIDLDGLTEQIVTRLDDRLIAHRERLGRAY